jgi:hypothetical protein
MVLIPGAEVTNNLSYCSDPVRRSLRIFLMFLFKVRRSQTPFSLFWVPGAEVMDNLSYVLIQGAEVTDTFLVVLIPGAEVTDNLSYCSDSVRRSRTTFLTDLIQ